MKKIILATLSFLIGHLAFCQVSYYIVEGTVIDRETKVPLQVASVFAQNTTIGTATDAAGHFILYLPNGGYDLIITFTGYTTETKRITSSDGDIKKLVIEIGKKEKAMEEVLIKASNEVKDGWEKYGDLFMENYIGKSANSRSCTLLNKNAVKFYYSKKKNRLKVLADSVLFIENSALGYTIKMALDSFTYEFNNTTSFYSGYPLFEEMQTTDESQKTIWAANRRATYNGSMLHLMRSLYNRQLKEEGFEIQFIIKIYDKDSAFKLSDYYAATRYVKDDSTQTVEILPIQPEMAVLYNKEKPELTYQKTNPDDPTDFQLSILSFVPDQSILIEQNGYFYEQGDITIHQYLGWKKMADMLPYDFQLK
jgi:hypothetical protein